MTDIQTFFWSPENNNPDQYYIFDAAGSDATTLGPGQTRRVYLTNWGDYFEPGYTDFSILAQGRVVP
jgi:hypothetical protein